MNAKSIIKKIALALAGVAALTAVGFGVKAIVDYTKNDLKTIHLSYDVGNLGADGKYVDDESTLYTKEAFGCYGLQVKPDFDSTVNYQIFYYDILDNYISSTSILSDGYSDEAPINGAYARIVIEPRNDEDGKISLTERIKYSNQLTVKVKKNQDINNRFVVFKGKIMQVVYETKNLSFANNLLFSNSSLMWVENDRCTATALTLLKVTGGTTLNFDATKLDEKYANAYYHVSQFKDLPTDDNFIPYSLPNPPQKSFVLDKQTKYIIISVDTNVGSLSWTDTEVSKMPSCFTITKN